MRDVVRFFLFLTEDELLNGGKKKTFWCYYVEKLFHNTYLDLKWK